MHQIKIIQNMAETKNQCLVKANQFEFLLDREEVSRLDIVRKSEKEFHKIHNGRSVSVTITAADHKHLHVELEGESFVIEIKDQLDLMLDKMGFSEVSSRAIKEIKAPMPGLVLEIAVAEGQELKEGDKVLILEAMKMENSIVISTNAVIKKILVKPGQPVDKGQVLIELE